MADVWYPSLWVRLQLRFEDFRSAQLAETLATLALENSLSGDPVDKAGFFGLDTVIIPRACTVTRNSYRKADEAKLTIPYGRVPLDPRIIRMGTVQVFAGAVDPQDFADTMNGTLGAGTLALVPEIGKGGKPTEIFRGFIDDWSITLQGDDAIEITARDVTAILIDSELPVDGLAGIPRNLTLDEVIRAVVVGEDAATGALPDNRQQRANRLAARRAVRILTKRIKAKEAKLDRAVDAGDDTLAIELGLEIAELTTRLTAAQGIAAVGDSLPVIAARYGLPSMRGLNVVNATGNPLPTLGDLKGAEWFDSKGNAKRSRRGGGSKRVGYWDFITDLCVGSGFICYFRTPTGEGLPPGSALPPAELVIDTPRTYYEDSGEEIREFIYGANVESIEVQRDYAGRNIPTAVSVSAVEDITGRPISARFPPAQSVNRAGGTSLPNTPAVGDREEVQTVLLRDRIPGFKAAETLARVAESIYQQVSRGEFGIKIKTSRLSHLPSNVDKSAVDMLSLQSGDTIYVEINPTDTKSLEGSTPVGTTAGDWTQLAEADRIRFLIESVGLNPVAAAIAAAASTDRDNVQRVFRVTEVSVSFDQDSGFEFEVEAINFLDARAGVSDIEATQALVAANLATETSLIPGLDA